MLDEQISLPEGAAVQVQIISALPADDVQAEIPTLAERLQDFIGILDPPEDAATNHDHYLYVTPKKR